MGFMDMIPSTSPKSVTSDTNFSYYLLIDNANSKPPKLHGMEKITNEEVKDKLYMFQAIYGKVDECGW